MNYCDDPVYRRDIQRILNRGESRNGLARDVFHGGGKLAQRYQTGQEGVVAEMRRRVEEEWCAPLRLAGVPYSTVVEVGLPAVVVQRAANAASPACVALGSRGLGSVSQRLLGSVTHRLLRELDWPTVVVPGPRDCVCWRPDAP